MEQFLSNFIFYTGMGVSATLGLIGIMLLGLVFFEKRDRSKK